MFVGALAHQDVAGRQQAPGYSRKNGQWSFGPMAMNAGRGWFYARSSNPFVGTHPSANRTRLARTDDWWVGAPTRHVAARRLGIHEGVRYEDKIDVGDLRSSALLQRGRGSPVL
jgi:hypothetical protein